MLKKEFFKRPKNELENYGRHFSAPDMIGDVVVNCPKCREILFTEVLNENNNVCVKCGYHFRINARQRVMLLTDMNTFKEHDPGVTAQNKINFPGYEAKLQHAYFESSESEAVVCGDALIGGFHCALFAMEPSFMMGSMGTVVGEKVTRLFEFAHENRLPVIGYTVSGGARMQEGILSLMQMAKTSGAVKRHADAGGLYIAILTDPTTGGVTASFAMEADYTLAEPGALIGFAGPRVIEQTIRQKLPPGFQSAEFLQKTGFVDAIVDRRNHKLMITKLFELHEIERESAALLPGEEKVVDENVLDEYSYDEPVLHDEDVFNQTEVEEDSPEEITEFGPDEIPADETGD